VSSEVGHLRLPSRRLDELKPHPANDRIYRPVSTDDPEVRELAWDIHDRGVKEPLIVSLDNYILSGHRRATAARLAGLSSVPVLVEPVRHDDPRAMALLVSCNRQRLKTPEELAREEVVAAGDLDPYEDLLRFRRESSRTAEPGGCVVEIEGAARRKRISPAKDPMLRAAFAVIEALKEYWPLSVRYVHYNLLNDPPLRHAGKLKSHYANDRPSYQDLCDLLLRARLEGLLSWDVIADETRPVCTWGVHQSVAAFVRRDLQTFLLGYRRDLQQGQPVHVEAIGEKNTIARILRPVCEEYSVPMTLGRGYCSGSPRKAIGERFARSGRDRLALIAVFDHDPEGEDAPHSFARSIRDEFGARDVRLIKAALTTEQVEELGLPAVLVAKKREGKKEGSRRKKYVERNGEVVHELEAVSPATLQQMTRAAIESVLDIDVFREQQELEKKDAQTLSDLRRRALGALGGAITQT
jgi:hypothetical protein